MLLHRVVRLERRIDGDDSSGYTPLDQPHGTVNDNMLLLCSGTKILITGQQCATTFLSGCKRYDIVATWSGVPGHETQDALNSLRGQLDYLQTVAEKVAVALCEFIEEQYVGNEKRDREPKNLLGQVTDIQIDQDVRITDQHLHRHSP